MTCRAPRRSWWPDSTRRSEQGNLGNWLAELAPQDEEYRLLAAAYVEASRQSEADRRNPIADGATLRPGRADPRLPAIAAALRSGGYLPAPAEGQPAPAAGRYGPDMVAAVRSLQEDYGLEPTGRIDAETVVALNQTAFDRVRTLAVNLERRRWLPRDAPPPTRIDVNTAAATLTYWRDGGIADQRRVVAGQPGNETPQLALAHVPARRQSDLDGSGVDRGGGDPAQGRSLSPARTTWSAATT